MGCRSLLVFILTARLVIGVTNGQGVGFVLNGISDYSNGSTVLRTDIGEGDAALQCTTDRVGCCAVDRVGYFYFPDDTQVPTSGNDLSRTYYRNRFSGGIRLNRRPSGTITGQFRCEIPDASGTVVNLFVNIVDPPLTPSPSAPPSITISITTSGTNAAGETYSLVCSATVTGSTDQPTITWLDLRNNTVPSEMVTTTGSMSTLTFSPLAASHAGTYTCRATATRNVTHTDTKVVSVENPSISVSIMASPVQSPVVGSVYSLTCTLTGAERLTDSTITYQWFKDGEVVSGQTMRTLSFPYLSFSDSGSYTCQTTIMSSLLSGPIITSTNNPIVVYLTLPTPIVTINSGDITVGSAVTLTCTVDLDPAVDVPVTVTTVWTGPAGFLTTTTAQPVMGNTNTYTSTATVSSFGRDLSGNYTCVATISSTSSFITISMASASNRVTVAASSPENVQACQSSASAPVEVSWSPPSGGDATITGYRIFYGNQQNIFVSPYVTRIVFNFIEIKNELGEILSIRSESTQLPSEPVNVRVTNEIVCHSIMSSSTNVCVAVGVTTFTALAAVVITSVIFLLCWLRRKKQSKKCEISVSANEAYGQVKSEPGGGEYEDPDKNKSGPGNYELMQHSADINNDCSGNQQMEAMYITTEDTSR